MINFPLSCRWCGASLRGLALEGKCPQCRHEVGDTLDRRLIDGERMAVNGDALCAQCNYNLRTMAVNGVCPECAHPVADSLRPNELRYADPAWVDVFRYGLRNLMIWSVASIVYLTGIIVIFPFNDIIPCILLVPGSLVLYLFWLFGITNALVSSGLVPKKMYPDGEFSLPVITALLTGIFAFCGICLGPVGIFLSLVSFCITSLLALVQWHQMAQRMGRKILARWIKALIIVSPTCGICGAITTFFYINNWAIFGKLFIVLTLLFVIWPTLILTYVIVKKLKIIFEEAIRMQNDSRLEKYANKWE